MGRVDGNEGCSVKRCCCWTFLSHCKQLLLVSRLVKFVSDSGVIYGFSALKQMGAKLAVRSVCQKLHKRTFSSFLMG